MLNNSTVYLTPHVLSMYNLIIGLDRKLYTSGRKMKQRANVVFTLVIMGLQYCLELLGFVLTKARFAS